MSSPLRLRVITTPLLVDALIDDARGATRHARTLAKSKQFLAGLSLLTSIGAVCPLLPTELRLVFAGCAGSAALMARAMRDSARAMSDYANQGENLAMQCVEDRSLLRGDERPVRLDFNALPAMPRL